MPLHFPDTPSRGGFEACSPVSLFGCLSNKPSPGCTLVSVIVFAVNRADKLGFGYIYYVPGIVPGTLHVLTHLI